MSPGPQFPDMRGEMGRRTCVSDQNFKFVIFMAKWDVWFEYEEVIAVDQSKKLAAETN
jgi:hypothetical protein